MYSGTASFPQIKVVNYLIYINFYHEINDKLIGKAKVLVLFVFSFVCRLISECCSLFWKLVKLWAKIMHNSDYSLWVFLLTNGNNALESVSKLMKSPKRLVIQFAESCFFPCVVLINVLQHTCIKLDNNL